MQREAGKKGVGGGEKRGKGKANARQAKTKI